MATVMRKVTNGRTALTWKPGQGRSVLSSVRADLTVLALNTGGMCKGWDWVMKDRDTGWLGFVCGTRNLDSFFLKRVRERC